MKLLQSPILAVTLLAGASQAFVIPGPDLYATLTQPVETALQQRRCMLPAGASVLIVGYPSSLGDSAVRQYVRIRVHHGECKGFEATIPETWLVEPPEH